MAGAVRLSVGLSNTSVGLPVPWLTLAEVPVGMDVARGTADVESLDCLENLETDEVTNIVSWEVCAADVGDAVITLTEGLET